MKTIKLVFLVLLSLVLVVACGKDSSSAPNTNIDKNFGDDNNNGHDTRVFSLKAKKVETFKIHNDFDCQNPSNKRKLNPQQRARKFQKLCQKAAPQAERKLLRKCKELIGRLSNVRLETFTSRSKFGFCRSLHCKVSATGSCSVD